MEQRILLAGVLPALQVQELDSVNITGRTEHKPQSKVWTHDDQWWAILPDGNGTHLWRLNEQTLEWTRELTLSPAVFKADVRADGNLAHILLFPDGPAAQLATLEYVPGTGGSGGHYQLWSQRPGLVNVTLGSSVESATLDVDSTGRLWVASDNSSTVEVRYSDLASNYASWSGPINVGTGISGDDISVVTALPPNTMLPDGTVLVDGGIGVFWSNQNTTLFGFRVHKDGDPPTVWSADESPASQSAEDVGDGFADDHVNVAVTSDGTLYVAIKTSFNDTSYPKIGLLVRRPNGVWDDLYEVDVDGTRPIVVVNEVQNQLMVIYDDGDIAYRASALDVIDFELRQALMGGRDVTSTKQNWVDELVLIAQDQGVLITTDPVTSANHPPVLTPIGDKSVNEGSLLQFTVSASDSDGDPLTYSTLGLPAGASFNPSTRVFSWTPTTSQDGEYDVTFRVSDGTAVVGETIRISVGAPTLGPVGNKSIAEGSLLEFTLLGSDGGGDQLTYTAAGLPAGAQLNSMTGTFRWTPAENQDGPHSVTFMVTDGFGTDSETITITVLEQNQPPVLASIGNRTIDEGELLEITLSATDGDIIGGVPDGLSYTAGPLPAGATFNNQTRIFRWTPAENQDGVHSITFQVSDGNVVDSETVTVTVREVNQLPQLAAIGDKSVLVGSLLAFTVSASDPEGTPLTYSADGVPPGGSFDPNTREFRWIPTSGQTGGHDVTFSVSDGEHIVSETVTITASDTPPVPAIAHFQDGLDGYSGTRDAWLRSDKPDKNYGDSVRMLIDGSPDRASLVRWDLSSLPGGTAVLSASITITITADSPDTFNLYELQRDWDENGVSWDMATSQQSWQVAGAQGSGEVGAVVLGVTPAGVDGTVTFQLNAAGVAVVQQWIDDPNSNFGFIFKNYNDAADKTLNFNSREAGDVDERPRLTLELSSGGTSDPPGDNSPPILAAIGNQTVTEGSLLAVTISASDDDGDSLDYSASGLPSGATFDPATRTFQWIPGESQDGPHTVTFHVADDSQSDSETITITVLEQNTPPVLTAIGNQAVDEGVLLELMISATDPDVVGGAPDGLTFSADALPAGATLDMQTGLFRWTPTEAQDGLHTITFHAFDGDATDSEMITITVNEVNQPPVLDPVGDKSVLVDNLLSFTISATDPEGTPLTYAATNLPPGADFDPSTREFRWTPSPAQTGMHEVTFQASDEAQSDSETITIAVTDMVSDPVTVRYQDGLNGYGGTTDTRFKSSRPDKNYGTNDELRVIGSPEYTSVIRWDVGSIPTGSVVTSASITVSVTSTTDDTYDIYELFRPWVENEANWLEFAEGQAWEVGGAQGGSDRSAASLGGITAPVLGETTVVLNAAGVAAVQAWVNDATSNHGVVFQNFVDASDSLDFWSREAGNVSARPALTVTYVPVGTSSGLLAASAPASPTVAEGLSAADLRQGADAAKAAWVSALPEPLADRAAELIGSVTFLVGELPHRTLGSAAGLTVTLDRDAAGFGWFVDQTPLDQSEFAQAPDGSKLAALPDSAAAGRIDLVTVIAHELGHILGFDHLHGELMEPTLPVGVRKLPENLDSAALDALFAGIADGDANPAWEVLP